MKRLINTKIAVIAAVFVFSSLSAYPQSDSAGLDAVLPFLPTQQKPASQPAGGTAADASKAEWQKLLKALNPYSNSTGLASPAASLGSAATGVVSSAMGWTSDMYKSLLPEAKAVAVSLLWAVLFAELTFTGFRLMLGSSIVEQLGLLTTKTFIYVIVAGVVPFPGAPKNYDTADGIIRSTMYRLMSAGRYVGAELIIKKAAHPNVRSIDGIAGINVTRDEIPSKNLSGPSDRIWTPQTWGDAAATQDAGWIDAEPLVYWLNWIGIKNAILPPGSSPYPITPDNEYKFSTASLTARIWGDNNSNQGSAAKLEAIKDEYLKDSDVKKAINDATGQKPEKPDFQSMAISVLMGTQPLQIFGMALSTAGIQIGALITIAFAEMSILVGSIVAFNIASILGLAILPLMYFRTFDKIWSQYLISLASLAMVPFFFYVLSAIGFVFSTYLFEVLFPLPPDGSLSSNSLAKVLNDMFFGAVAQIMEGYGSSMLAFIGPVLTKIISLVVALYLKLGRIIFGSTVVAAFITAGSLFALLAPSFAFRWQSGFGAEEAMSKIGEVFNGLQSSIGSGMGQMYSDAIQRGGTFAKGFGRGGTPGK